MPKLAKVELRSNARSLSTSRSLRSHAGRDRRSAAPLDECSNGRAEGSKVATGTVRALKNNPIALVVINLTFLLAFAFMLRDVSQAVERKDELLAELAKRCVIASPNKGNQQ